MSHWRRRSRHDLRRERILSGALERSQADVTKVTLRIRGSTAVLAGYVACTRDRSSSPWRGFPRADCYLTSARDRSSMSVNTRPHAARRKDL
jgi:hypothetical protein